ncbi:MAG: hypothetical protein QGI36_06155, partial [Candidatus Thalassarchaeaceae archaeon]|nr:hypothetical protein [Candidatus Thalassarchaeaceae archaeon]
MVDGRWRDISLRLASVGLFAGASAQSKLMEMEDPFKVIEVAKNLGVSGVLTEDVLQKLIEQTGPNKGGIDDEKSNENSIADMVPILDGTENAEKQHASQGRVIAPIETPEPQPPSRPHNLPHYAIDGFPMVATDVDTELEVHFDITGKSITEGKLSDMLSLFNNRLEKIKRILVQSGRMRNRPIEVSHVIRDQTRYSS